MMILVPIGLTNDMVGRGTNMTKSDFIKELIGREIDPDSISFDETTKDGYGVRRVYHRWEIFFRERGTEFYTKGYPTESDALIALLDDISNNRS